MEPNPEVMVEWRIPAAQRFGEFFSPRQSDLKANFSGWPTFPHHTLKTERPMCLQFQMTGEFTANCTNLHILPSAMPTKSWDEVRKQLKKIIGS